MTRPLFVFFKALFPAYAGVILVYDYIYRKGYTFPRIRGGDPVPVAALAQARALFPAYAGVILRAGRGAAVGFAFPRIRGGDPNTWSTLQAERNFSPHTRG